MDAERLAAVWKDSLSGPDAAQDPGRTLRSAQADATLSGGSTVAGATPTLSGGSTVAGEAPTLSGGSTVAGEAPTLSGGGTVAGEGGPETPPTAILRSTVPTYVLLDELGRGGMGVVHRARQSGLEREVAIKRIIGGTAAASLTGRFIAEARVTGNLDHPNIVPVHELGRAPDGEVFLAMKLVGGTSWKDLLHPGDERTRALAAGWDVERHLGVLLAVCNAVGFAHARSIVHRDLKPENVMVGEFGEVLVMDWGLALDVSEHPSQSSHAPHRSQVLAPAGTPSYMAPEMADGRGGDIGPWTDVYLLGAILHEILTGRPPHRGDSLLAVLVAASRNAAARFAPECPGGLAQLCARAMASDPRQRFADASALRDALQAYLKNRASERVAEAAASVLARCTGAAPRDDAGRTRLYGDYAEAVAGFAQALSLWQGNEIARTGERAARLAYASAALGGGDLGLAEAQIARLPAGDGEAGRVQASIHQARAARAQAARSARRLRLGLAAAGIAIVSGLTLGYILVSAARSEAERNLVRAEAETVRSQTESWRARVASALDTYRRGLNAIAEQRPDEASAWFLRAYEIAPSSQRPAGFKPTASEPADADFAWRAYHLVGIGLAKPPDLDPGPGILVRDLAIDARGRLFIACSDRLLVMAADGLRVERSWPIACRAIGLADHDRTLLVMTPGPKVLFIDPVSGATQGELDLPEKADPTILATARGSELAAIYDSANNRLSPINAAKRIFEPVERAGGRSLAHIAISRNSMQERWHGARPQPFPQLDANRHIQWWNNDTYRIGSADDRSHVEILRMTGMLQMYALAHPGWPGHQQTQWESRGLGHQIPFQAADRFEGAGALRNDGTLLLLVGDEVHRLSLPMDGPRMSRRAVPALSGMRSWACDDSLNLLAWLAPRQAGGMVHRVNLGDRTLELDRSLDAISESGQERELVFTAGSVNQKYNMNPLSLSGKTGVPYDHLSGAVPTADGRHVVVYLRKLDRVEAQVWSTDGWRLESTHLVPLRTRPSVWAAVVGQRIFVDGFRFNSDGGGSLQTVSAASALELRYADQVDERTLATGGPEALYIAPMRFVTASQPVVMAFGAGNAVPQLLPLADESAAAAMVTQESGLPWPHRLRIDAQGAWLLTLRDGRLTVIATTGGRRFTLGVPGADSLYQNAEIAADGRSVLVWQAGAGPPLRLLAIDHAAIAAALTTSESGPCPALREVLALPQGRLKSAVLADDGRSAVLIRADRTISMIDLPGGDVRWSRHGHEVGNACIQPQGFVVATWSGDDVGTLGLIDARTGDLLRSRRLAAANGASHRQPPMVFTPDGRSLLVALHGSLSVVPVFREGYGQAPPRLEAGTRRADGPLAEHYRRIACQVLDQGPEAGQIVYDSVRLDVK